MALATGSPTVRERLATKVKEQQIPFGSFIHPRVERSEYIEYGQGTIICAGCILTTNIKLADQVQINLDCTIGHDVVMGKLYNACSRVHVSGWVHFGRRVYVGTGAVIINGTMTNPLTIGDDSVIGAGACVTKPVDRYTRLFGRTRLGR